MKHILKAGIAKHTGFDSVGVVPLLGVKVISTGDIECYNCIAATVTLTLADDAEDTAFPIHTSS